MAVVVPRAELVVLRGMPHGLLNFRWVAGVGGVEETLRGWAYDALRLRVHESSRTAVAARGDSAAGEQLKSRR